MTAKYQIEITAKDRTSAAVNSASKNLKRLVEHTPLEGAHAKLLQLKDKKDAFQGLIQSFRGMGETSRVAAGGVGEVGAAAEEVGAAGGAIEGAAGAMGLLGAAAGPVGLALTAAAIGMSAGAKAAGDLAGKSSEAGAALAIFAQQNSVAAEVLQQWQVAGREFGVTAQGMGAAFAGLGNTLDAAFAGRAPEAMKMISVLGIHVRRLKDGSIDTADAMGQVAASMQGQTAQGQQLIAQTLGVSSAEAFLIQRVEERRKAMDAAGASGLIKTKAQTEAELHLHQSIERTKNAFAGFLNLAVENVTIPLANKLFDFLDGVLDRIQGIKLAIGGGHSPPPGGAGHTSGGTPINNPGNIRPVNGRGFLQFATAAEGLEADAAQLLIYKTKHGLDTIEGIVNRWAPPGDHNPTEAYIRNLARRTGWARGRHIDMSDPEQLASLMDAQIIQENGRDRFSHDQLLTAARHQIDIHLHGAPAGTQVAARSSSPNVKVAARVASSMPGVPV